MRHVVLAIDVGGTSLKGAAVASDGRVEERARLQVEAFACASKDAILDHLYDTVKVLAALAEQTYPGERICFPGVGFAFPGPFDYERGISYIRGLGKYEALFGVGVKAELERRIAADDRLSALLASPPRLSFGNDASLFALGEAAHGVASRYRRSICLTVGTGLGSGFIEDGRLVADRGDVPQDGWLFRLPWEDGIVDDYASRRGILRMAEGFGYDTKQADVRELAEAARAGDTRAVALFEQFGRELGRIVAAYGAPFRPEAVVLGGQISNASPLFAPAMADQLAGEGCPVQIAQSEDTLLSTFRGIRDLVTASAWKGSE